MDRRRERGRGSRNGSCNLKVEFLGVEFWEYFQYKMMNQTTRGFNKKAEY